MSTTGSSGALVHRDQPWQVTAKEKGRGGQLSAPLALAATWVG